MYMIGRVLLQDAYCEALHKYHEDLIRPMDEAMAFLANIKLQVNNEDYNATMLMKDSYRDHHHHNYNQYAGNHLSVSIDL